MSESEMPEYELIAPGSLCSTDKCLILTRLGDKSLIPPEASNVV